MVPIIRLVVATALLAAGVAGAQVFKWTDANGKTHYGDKPPEDVTPRELAIQVPSYDGPVEVRDWSAILKRKSPATEVAASAGAVTMYSTSWCPHCKRARAYFAQKGIAFTEMDVEKSAEGRRAYKALGGGGVPIIVVGDKMMRGFSPQAFERLKP